MTDKFIEEMAEGIASRLDGRTVTSHAHYREMLAEELKRALLAQKKQIEEKAVEWIANGTREDGAGFDYRVIELHQSMVGTSPEYRIDALKKFILAAVKEALSE